jgi:hypothetical protein
MTSKEALAAALAAAIGACAGFAHAQQVFKYVLPNGQVVYSDKPVPGGRLVDEIAPPPPSAGVPPPRPEVQPAQPTQRDALRERLSDRDREFQRATANLDDARARLAQAERDLVAGKEPLPGERTGNVGGGSRLNEMYWQRQANNEAAVANARAQVQRAEVELQQLR